MAEGYDTIPEKASREATDWLIRLQEEPGDRETERAFRQWLAASPANAAAWSEMQYVADAFTETALPQGAAWSAFLERSRTKQPRSGSRRGWAAPAWGWPRLEGAVAALLLIALLAGSVFFVDKFDADHKTGAAELRTVMLDDGSSVTLAPQSAVDVSIDADRRYAHLISGKAYFDVASDPGRPFQVETGDAVVTVLGTGFEVRQDGDETAISVGHGRVRVAPLNAPAAAHAFADQVLTQGETLRIGATGEATKAKLPVWRIAAWREGRLIGQDTAMEKLVDELRDYYRGKIIITDKTFASLPVTGIYNLNNPASALKAVASAQNGRIRQITPWLMIISPAPAAAENRVKTDIARPAEG